MHALCINPFLVYYMSFQSFFVLNKNIHNYRTRYSNNIQCSTDDVAKTIASSLVGSQLDYANAILVGTSFKNIKRLHHIQNTLARIVMKVPHDQTRNMSTKHLLSTLLWLPVRRRIDFKIAVLT